MQGSRSKNGKDNEEEDVQITEEEAAGTNYETSANPDNPIIKTKIKVRDTSQLGNITAPTVKFSVTDKSYDQVICQDNFSEINKSSATQNHFYTKKCFPQMKEDPKQESSFQSLKDSVYHRLYGQYPYQSNPFYSHFPIPTQCPGLVNNQQNAFNFENIHEQRRRMSPPYPYKPHHNFICDMFTKESYLPQSSLNGNNFFMQSTMQDKLFNISPGTPIPSNKPMQHNLSQRTSVIRSSKRKQTSKLQYKADMLKHEGSILRHTGRCKCKMIVL